MADCGCGGNCGCEKGCDCGCNPKVVVVKSSLLDPSPGWRHPIRHFKLRHLRADMEAEKRLHEIDPLYGEISRRRDGTFINGNSDRSGRI